MVDAVTRHEHMLEGAFEFIGLLAPDGLLLDVNHAGLAFFRTTLSAVVGRPIWEPPWVETPEHIDQLRLAVREARSGRFVRRILQRRAPNGRVEDIDFSLSPLTDESGRVAFLVGEGRVVTGLVVNDDDRAPDARVVARMRGLVDRGRARPAGASAVAFDESSWHSERAYRAAFQSGLAKAEVDIESGRALAVNQRLADLFQTPPDGLAGKPVAGLFASDSWPHLQLACADLLREPRTPRIARVRCRVREGRELPVEVVMSAVECHEGEKPTTCVMSFQDVSRLAVAEQRRDSAEALTSALVESAGDGIIVVDVEGDVELFNPAATRMFGYRRDEIMGRPADGLVPGWRRAEQGPSIPPDQPSSRSEPIGVGREVEGRRKDGSTFPLFLSVSEMLVGTARKFTCVAHDLSALRQAQHEAVRARERFELAARGALDALWEWSAEPPASFYLSDRFWELLEYRRGDLPDSLETFSSLVHPDDRDVAFQAMRERLAMRAPFVVELRLRRKRGDYRWFRGHGHAVWGADALPMRMAGSLSDITEERLAKEQLAEQRVLAELGKMAAVVVHEVRNPIAGVQGALDVLIGRRSEDDEERVIMLKMRRRLDSLSELVGDLLVYSRPKPVTLHPIHLRDVFESVSSLAATTPVCSHIALDVSCADVVLSADGPALGRALLNLLLNAAQAMGGSGHIAMSATASGDTLTIVVADTGPGMAPGVLQRLFEPFYTTKKGGTGLGLCIARRIVEQHGGVLGVESEPGRGTKVVIRLPAANLAPTEAASSRHPEAPSA